MASKMIVCACLVLLVAGATAMEITEVTSNPRDNPTAARPALTVTPPSDQPLSPAEPLPNYAAVLPYDGSSNGENPQQIHLTVWGSPTSMLVSLITGEPKVTPAAPTPADVPNVSKNKPQARFGLTQTKYRTVTGKAVNYFINNAWDFQPPNNSMGYVSAPINHVLLNGLKSATTYSYQVSGGKDKPWSPWFTLTTAPKGFPITVGMMADSGNSQNGTDTMLRMLGRKPAIVHLLGDLSYADAYDPNGVWNSGDKKNGKYSTTFPQAWDQWERAMQPMFTAIPVMTTPGNHELEFQPPTQGGAVFSAYNTRFPMPQTTNPIAQTANLSSVSNDTVLTSKQTTNMYYSYIIPGVAKMIFITSYIPSDHYTNTTAQYKWLESELKKVNRKSTPWIVIGMHAPWYSSWAGSFKDTECHEAAYKVDLVFNGHTHGYERYVPVFNNTANECGTVHITVGMGGKPGQPPDGFDALDDEPISAVKSAYCNSTAAFNKKMLGKITLMGNSCPTIQPDFNGGSATMICWTSQPPISAIRNAAYGMGTLEFISASQARWKMFRNADDPNTPFDEVVFDRSLPAKCSGKN